MGLYLWYRAFKKYIPVHYPYQNIYGIFPVIGGCTAFLIKATCRSFNIFYSPEEVSKKVLTCIVNRWGLFEIILSCGCVKVIKFF